MSTHTPTQTRALDPGRAATLGHHGDGADISQLPDNSGLPASITERFDKLERKVLEQERTITELKDDIKSLKMLQNSDRKEYYDRFTYQETKTNETCEGLNRFRQRIKNLESQVASSQKDHDKFAEVDIRSLSLQLGDLRSHVDQVFAGIQGADAPPPASDLIDFSPGRPLIDRDDETTEHRPTSDSSNTTRGNLIEEQHSSTSRPPSVLSDGRTFEHDLPKRGPPTPKHVRFDLSDTERRDTGRQLTTAHAPDPTSDDPLIADFMAFERRSRNKTPAAPEKGVVPKTTDSKTLLDKFRNGDLESESDDSDEIVVASRAPSAENDTGEVSLTLPVRKSKLHKRSSDPWEENRSRTRAYRNLESNMDLATQAFVVVQKASAPVSSDTVAVASDHMAPPATRKSQRARKPKDFGDVEVHHGSKKRAKRS